MLRLFVGLELPQTVRARLALLASGLPGARWLGPETHHLTLAFAGEIDEGRAEDMDRELSLVRGIPFELEISGVGGFESKGKLRALWAGVAPSEELALLQARVAEACKRAGIQLEARKFKPHVTLARFREQPGRERLGAWLGQNSLLLLEPFRIEAFALFRSHLGATGPHYERLALYPLRRGKT